MIVRIISWGRNLRKAYWVIFVFLILSPIVIDVHLVFNSLPLLQESFPFWEFKPSYFILSDILFIEGAFLLVAGAILAGFTLYTMVVPTKLIVTYVKEVFSWETIKKEHEIPEALKIGLLLISGGITYISTAIIITL
jgi:hypothetical protein